MLSLFCKLTAKCISLLGKKKKKKSWQVPMASLSSTWVSSGRWQKGWHKTCFLQASYLRGTWLLRSLSILPNDVIAGCHLVYLECAVSQINTLFNCRSRYGVSLPANAWDTSHGTDLGGRQREIKVVTNMVHAKGGERCTTLYFKMLLHSSALKAVTCKALKD